MGLIKNENESYLKSNGLKLTNQNSQQNKHKN